MLAVADRFFLKACLAVDNLLAWQVKDLKSLITILLLLIGSDD